MMPIPVVWPRLNVTPSLSRVPPSALRASSPTGGTLRFALSDGIYRPSYGSSMRRGGGHLNRRSLDVVSFTQERNP